MRLYFIALQFLTIIPLPLQVRCDERDLGRSMALFPLVGLTLGLLLAGAQWLLEPLLPASVSDLLLVALLALITGGLHLDGLADVCDGLAARGGRERFLEVMKDSRIGAVGAVGLLLVLALKYQALLAMAPEWKRGSLLLFPCVARCGQVLLTVGARRARQDGLGAAFIGGAGAMQLAVALPMTLGISFLTLSWQGVAAAAAVFSFAGLCRWYFQRRLGGITGDVIGCVSELGEVGCLLVLLALHRIS